jgi:putative ABC transport system ATP-binding protein
MEAHKDKMPASLSGGEQQRIAIARSLANDAPVLFADEPTGNLDSENSNIVFELLKSLNEKGKTIVMVTHEREMIQGATRKIVLKDGKIIEDSRVQWEGNGYEQAII